MSSLGAVNMAGSASTERVNGFISASRIQLDEKQVAKAPDGSAIYPAQAQIVPSMGIEPLDNTAHRLNMVAGYAPDVVNATSSAAIKGGIYGALGGLIIGLLTQGAGIVGDLIFARRIPGGAVGVLLFTGIGGALGAFAGFKTSSRENAKELQAMLFSGKPPGVKLPKPEVFEEGAK